MDSLSAEPHHKSQTWLQLVALVRGSWHLLKVRGENDGLTVGLAQLADRSLAPVTIAVAAGEDPNFICHFISSIRNTTEACPPAFEPGLWLAQTDGVGPLLLVAQLPATSDEERLDASAEQLLCRQLLGLCCLISSAILLPLSQPSLVNSPAVTSLFHHLLTSAQHMQAHAADPHAPNLPGILEELGLHTRLPRVHAQNRDTHTTRRPQLLLLPHQPEPASEALTAAAQLHALMAEVTNPSPDPSTIQAGKGRTDAELHHASIEDAHEQLMSTSSQLLDSMFHGYCTKLVDCYGGDMGDVASSVRLMLKSVFADITAFPLPPALPPATAKAFWGRYSNPMLTLASPAASLTGGLTPDADPSEETVPGQTTATLTATAARPTTARPTTASIQNSTGSNTQQGPALSADYVRVTAALGTLVSRLLPPKAVGASLLRPQMLSQLCDAYIQLCAGLGATCRMRNGRMLASQMSRSRTTRASNSSVVGLIGLTGSAGYDRRSAVTDARTVGPASAPCDSSKAGFGAAPGTGMSRLAASSPVPGTSGSSGEQGADSSDHRLPNLPQTWAYMAQLECKDAMEFGLEEYGDSMRIALYTCDDERGLHAAHKRAWGAVRKEYLDRTSHVTDDIALECFRQLRAKCEDQLAVFARQVREAPPAQSRSPARPARLSVSGLGAGAPPGPGQGLMRQVSNAFSAIGGMSMRASLATEGTARPRSAARAPALQKSFRARIAHSSEQEVGLEPGTPGPSTEDKVDEGSSAPHAKEEDSAAGDEGEQRRKLTARSTSFAVKVMNIGPTGDLDGVGTPHAGPSPSAACPTPARSCLLLSASPTPSPHPPPEAAPGAPVARQWSAYDLEPTTPGYQPLSKVSHRRGSYDPQTLACYGQAMGRSKSSTSWSAVPSSSFSLGQSSLPKLPLANRSQLSEEVAIQNARIAYAFLPHPDDQRSVSFGEHASHLSLRVSRQALSTSPDSTPHLFPSIPSSPHASSTSAISSLGGRSSAELRSLRVGPRSSSGAHCRGESGGLNRRSLQLMPDSDHDRYSPADAGTGPDSSMGSHPSAGTGAVLRSISRLPQGSDFKTLGSAHHTPSGASDAPYLRPAYSGPHPTTTTSRPPSDESLTAFPSTPGAGLSRLSQIMSSWDRATPLTSMAKSFSGLRQRTAMGGRRRPRSENLVTVSHTVGEGG